MAQKGVTAVARAAAITAVDVMLGAYGTPFMRSNNPSWCVDQIRKAGASKIWITAVSDYTCVGCIINVARSNADAILHWMPSSSPEVLRMCKINADATTMAIKTSYLESKRLGTRSTFAMCSLAKRANPDEYRDMFDKEIRERACVFGKFSGCMDWATNPERFENAPDGFDLHRRKVVVVTMRDEVYTAAAGKWIRVGLVGENAIEAALA